MGTQVTQSLAWAALVAATLASTWSSAHLGTPTAIVAAVCTLAAAKALVVMHQFMGLGGLPPPLRWFFIAWAAGCATMIVAFAAS